jgi:2'-5' RNA ligase
MKQIFLRCSLLFSLIAISACSSMKHVKPLEQPVINEKTWLGKSLDYARYLNQLTSIEKKNQVKLLSRGEAHITLITPPEYKDTLSKVIPMSRIEDLYKTMDIDSVQFTEICIGEAKINKNSKDLKTWFVVIKSPQMLEFRKAVQKEFEAAGGVKGSFDALNWYPHITLGYTERDLHASDGVIKDITSCIK